MELAMSENCCTQCGEAHASAVDAVAAKLTNSRTLGLMAEVFDCFSDPTRLKLINALLLSELCVSDITRLLKLSQPSVSHHLKLLKQARLVKSRRDGKIIYYSLDDYHVAMLFDLAKTHLSESEFEH